MVCHFIYLKAIFERSVGRSQTSSSSRVQGEGGNVQVQPQGVNVGRVKAEEAARTVGGKALFPIFAPGENAYPAELAPVTPQRYRAHLRATQALADAQKGVKGATLTETQTAELKRAQLSDKELAALERMKVHTDFNDLATRSVLGREGVERQVKVEVGRMIREASEKREARQRVLPPQPQALANGRLAERLLTAARASSCRMASSVRSSAPWLSRIRPSAASTALTTGLNAAETGCSVRMSATRTAPAIGTDQRIRCGTTSAAGMWSSIFRKSGSRPHRP